MGGQTIVQRLKKMGADAALDALNKAFPDLEFTNA
jgi:SOS-response transcriptional repressor LexA